MSDTQREIVHPFEWVKSSSFSLISERELAIYQMGKQKGVAEFHENLEKLTEENFSKSYEDTNKVIKKLRDKNLNVISARMKMESSKSFKILIVINDSSEFSILSDSIYDYLFELEHSRNNSDYRIDFSILRANPSFSETCVENDGYIYKHRLLPNEERTRTA